MTAARFAVRVITRAGDVVRVDYQPTPADAVRALDRYRAIAEDTHTPTLAGMVLELVRQRGGVEVVAERWTLRDADGDPSWDVEPEELGGHCHVCGESPCRERVAPCPACGGSGCSSCARLGRVDRPEALAGEQMSAFERLVHAWAARRIEERTTAVYLGDDGRWRCTCAWSGVGVVTVDADTRAEAARLAFLAVCRRGLWP